MIILQATEFVRKTFLEVLCFNFCISVLNICPDIKDRIINVTTKSVITIYIKKSIPYSKYF